MKFEYLVDSAVVNYGGQKLTKKLAEQLIRGVFEDIKNGLTEGESLTIRGFGSFKTIDKKGRVYVEPRNQTRIEKPPSKYPKFTPSQLLKDAVNG
jgi:nucleoid DNA-binding protein